MVAPLLYLGANVKFPTQNVIPESQSMVLGLYSVDLFMPAPNYELALLLVEYLFQRLSEAVGKSKEIPVVFHFDYVSMFRLPNNHRTIVVQLDLLAKPGSAWTRSERKYPRPGLKVASGCVFFLELDYKDLF
jgi:hypothetical protein